MMRTDAGTMVMMVLHTLLELGKKVVADATTPMSDADGGLTFDDGNNELNNTTWDIEATT